MKPGYCPKCNAQIEDYGFSETGDNDRSYPFKCPKCGFEGAELYNEVFAGFLDDDGNDVEEDDSC